VISRTKVSWQMEWPPINETASRRQNNFDSPVKRIKQLHQPEVKLTNLCTRSHSSRHINRTYETADYKLEERHHNYQLPLALVASVLIRPPK
jgi:hypothetical protein